MSQRNKCWFIYLFLGGDTQSVAKCRIWRTSWFHPRANLSLEWSSTRCPRGEQNKQSQPREGSFGLHLLYVRASQPRRFGSLICSSLSPGRTLAKCVFWQEKTSPALCKARHRAQEGSWGFGPARMLTQWHNPLFLAQPQRENTSRHQIPGWLQLSPAHCTQS